MSGNRPYSIFLLLCIALLFATLSSATIIPSPIYENFDNQAAGVNGWTETGGNGDSPTGIPLYNYNSSSNGLGCCPSPGFISLKDANKGGPIAVLTAYAPLALFPQNAGLADLSSFDIDSNGGTAFYIHFAIKQLSNQGNKPLTGNTGKIDITGQNGVTIQANLYDFVACPTCFNLPVGWNLPTNNNLISFGVFNTRTGAPVNAPDYDYSQYIQTISHITSFAIELELHGDGSDEVGFDGFGIDEVPEPSYTVVLLGAGVIGFFYKRRQSKVS